MSNGNYLQVGDLFDLRTILDRCNNLRVKKLFFVI